MADSCDWFTDIQIQSGLKFDEVQGDVTITRPLGLGVVTNTGALLYCRVIM